MKKVLLAFAVLLGLVACTTNKATSAEKSVVSSEVPFTVAEHYFFLLSTTIQFAGHATAQIPQREHISVSITQRIPV